MVGSAKKDHATLRALSALIASLPASENKEFREEFDTVNAFPYYTEVLLISRYQEYEDVQLTAYLATLTKSANLLNDVSLSRICQPSANGSHNSASLWISMLS